MIVTVKGGTLSQKEINEYILEMKKRHPDQKIKSMTLTLDNDEVEINYEYESVPFERIRRITGYLVGTIERFNDAKRAEVNDRVKHSLCDCRLENIA